MKRNHHDTVDLLLGDRTVAVDAELAGVILGLWDLGIRTRACCQGSLGVDPVVATRKDFAYIMFEDIDGLRAFLDLFEGTDLAGRRFGQRWNWADDGVSSVPVLPRAWTFDAGVHQPRHDAEHFVISGTVRLLPADIDRIESVLQSRLQGARIDGVRGK
jgi:hypothetical protein